ncbi:ATP-binding cassette domain-containing protein [Dactylosporangium sp. NPDC050588]|uniref:ATP-binding cassette domain-containing protein n=1 Tax=Dactylosporangium sp. NPDC050588 TaxID=3157211 RepID=UPI0033FADEB0
MSVVEARGLGARTRRGWVFRDVDLDVAAGERVTVTGPAGSGRTSLLLALAGCFRTSAGTVRREGVIALAHVPGVHEPEPALTVAEHVEERRLLLDGPFRRRRPVAIDPALDPGTLGRDLDVLGRHLLGITLARVAAPAAVVVDDVDSGLSIEERALLDEALDALTADGIAVIAAAREVAAAGTGSVFELEGQR